MRYHTRGTDPRGNVANFVETEQVIRYASGMPSQHHNITSYTIKHHTITITASHHHQASYHHSMTPSRHHAIIHTIISCALSHWPCLWMLTHCCRDHFIVCAVEGLHTSHMGTKPQRHKPKTSSGAFLVHSMKITSPLTLTLTLATTLTLTLTPHTPTHTLTLNIQTLALPFTLPLTHTITLIPFSLTLHSHSPNPHTQTHSHSPTHSHTYSLPLTHTHIFTPTPTSTHTLSVPLTVFFTAKSFFETF